VNDVEMWTPEAGEILIKVVAVATNPIDNNVQKLGMFFEEFPVTIGFDVAGIVESVGQGVSDFKTGDKVMTSRVTFDMSCQI
jgi:NADPH:quinone reductase-like Zn-dependent oxidoreductase